MAGLNITLLRHPRVVAEAGTCYGLTDLPAEPEHAAQCVADWVRALPSGAIIVSSPLSRCEQQSEQICRQRGDIASKTDVRLLELNFGDWEGRPWGQIGELAMAPWMLNFLHRPPGTTVLGEAVIEMLDRVAAAMLESHDRPVVWLTHAGVIRSACALARGTPIQTAGDWPADPIGFGSSTPLHFNSDVVLASLANLRGAPQR